jgi:hypothetical protein
VLQAYRGGEVFKLPPLPFRLSMESLMKSGNLWGIVLIVLGVISLAYAGISYTRREEVLKIGSLVASADRTETIPIPPWVGGIALVAGIAILASRRNS